MGRQQRQALIVGNYRPRRVVADIAVPETDKTKHNRQIHLQGRSAKVLVHDVATGQKVFKMISANGDHDRQANGGPQGIAAANPIPEAEHVRRINAELRHFRSIRRDRDKMLGNGRFIAPQTGEQPGASRMGIGHRL